MLPPDRPKSPTGNFVMVRLDEDGERLPLTIADYDKNQGTITLSSVSHPENPLESLKSRLEIGDTILDFVGPLGKAAEIEKYENPVVVVGGGVGIAAAYSQAKEMKAIGNYVISIIGGRTVANLPFGEKKCRPFQMKLSLLLMMVPKGFMDGLPMHYAH